MRFYSRQTIKIKIMLGLGILALTTSASFGSTLQDAVNQTLNTHPDILRARSAQGASASDIRQAQGGWLPTFDVEAGVGHENTNNPATRAVEGGDVNFTRQESEFLIQQLLFDGGNVSNQIRQAKADYRTRSFQVSETRELLGFQASEAYLNVLRNRELVTISEYNVKAHEDLYRKVGKRLKAGAGRKSELQLADSRLALTESELDRRRGRLHDANDTYVKVIGAPVPKRLSMPRPPMNIPHSLIKAQQYAMAVNPTIHATDAQISSNQAAKGVAKSAYFPTITLDVSQTFNDNLDGVKGYNNDRQEMLRMTYNIFNGGSDKAAVEAANYRIAEAQHESANTRRNIAEDVALAWNDLQSNLNREPSLQTHVTQSYNVWQAYEKQFQLGQRTLFDLLNAQSEYYDARAALTEVQYDVRIGRYRLLAAIGVFVKTVENANTNKLADPYQKIWSPTKKLLGITQSTPTQISNSPLVMSNKLATGQMPAKSIPLQSNFMYSPVHTSMKPADVDGTKKAARRKPVKTESTKKPWKKKVNKTQVKNRPIKPVKAAEPETMGKYTIQLMSSHNKQHIDKLAHNSYITKQTQVFKVPSDKPWYVLTYGQYKNKKAAEYARQALPKDLLKLKPVVRNVNHFKKAETVS